VPKLWGAELWISSNIKLNPTLPINSHNQQKRQNAIDVAIHFQSTNYLISQPSKTRQPHAHQKRSLVSIIPLLLLLHPRYVGKDLF
jgi:hypothetical protein